MYFPGPILTLLVTTGARYRVPGTSTRHGADIGLGHSDTSNEISPAEMPDGETGSSEAREERYRQCCC